MKAADSVADFVAAPAGTVLARRTFMLCAPSRQRFVAAHLASLDATEMPLVPQLVALPGSAGLDAKYDILYDVGAVEAMDRATFVVFEQFVRAIMQHLVVRTRRFAMVRPPGLSGHMFSGMAHDWLVPQLGERVEMFDQRDAAFAWLAFPADERAAVEQALDAFLHTSPLLRQMRELLARDLRAPSLDAIAAQLHVSARSLQRQLTELGTTFRDEVTRARVRAAQAMLAGTDDKIEAIARALGFRSVAAFTAMFRTEVGDTPTAFRARHRAGQGRGLAPRR